MHLLGILSALLLALPTGQAAPAYMIETTPTKRVEAVLSLEITTPNLRAKEWILFAARLPELPGQTAVKSKMNHSAEKLGDLSSEHRPLLRARVKATNDTLSKITIVATYETQLEARKLVPVPGGTKPPRVTPLAAEERKQFLAATDLINFKSDAFKKWLKDNQLNRLADENEVDYGKRVYEHMVKNFKYEYLPKMDRVATAVCKAGKSDCGGMSIVFVAAMRGHGIPARLRVGHWAQSAKAGDKLGEVLNLQQHAWAEFFCDGIGWVPVDPSVGVGAFKSGNSMDWFGHDHGNFITLHLDHGLILDTVYFGKQTAAWLQSPTYWVTGTGSLDGTTTTENWQVRELK